MDEFGPGTTSVEAASLDGEAWPTLFEDGDDEVVEEGDESED